ncbi:MAG: ACT domain-containing protein [Candidatus Acidiferrales bacterium]
MPKVKQLTVSCENRPGTLADIAGMLGKAKINILAFNASSAGAMGYIQLVVDNANKAKKVLKAHRISCYEEVVLHVTLPNVPGALSSLARKMADKGINIGAGYQTTVEGGKRASVVLAVSHLASATRIR